MLGSKLSRRRVLFFVEVFRILQKRNELNELLYNLIY